MQITYWQKLIIMSRMAVVFVRDTCHEVFGSFFVKNKRAYASKIVHAWAFRILNILKVEYKIFNPYDFKFLGDRPYIIMSNHASHFDIPLIYSTFPQDIIGMIAKKELFRIPIFGWGMKISGCVSIDRQDRYQALKDLKTAEQNMREGVRIWVAPEGTRSRTGVMAPFKKGGFRIAQEVKAIIVPVTIIGSGKILSPDTLDFSIGEKVEVHIGKPIDTLNYLGKDLRNLMADVASEITSKLGGTR